MIYFRASGSAFIVSRGDWEGGQSIAIALTFCITATRVTFKRSVQLGRYRHSAPSIPAYMTADDVVAQLTAYRDAVSPTSLEGYAFTRLLNQSIEIDQMCSDLDATLGWAAFEVPANTVSRLEGTICFISQWSYLSEDQKSSLIGPLRRAINSIAHSKAVQNL